MVLVVTCPHCWNDTSVSSRDRNCSSCGQYVPDGAIEPVEPSLPRGDRR